jgi:UDP-N-acetylglucosamine diphosphorylase/glucosamine-1-phosphate N-acetyltransferase
VLDARSGPIYLGQGTIVRPHSYLRGPLSIGPGCRLGGEVTHSLFHGYSNKAHYGFIGHSYIGEWVNLGAGTTNSNLKNNYGTVKVQVNGKQVDSGQQFLGCFIGDYAKTGIGTLINTGTVIGLGANVLGGQVTPKSIPDLQWDEKSKYRLDDFLKAAETMMARRGIKMAPAKADLIRSIFAAR